MKKIKWWPWRPLNRYLLSTRINKTIFMLNLSITLTTIKVQTCFAACDIIFTEIMFDNEKETWQKEIAKSSQRAGPKANYRRWHISLNFGKQKLNYTNYGVRPQLKFPKPTKAKRNYKADEKKKCSSWENNLRCGWALSLFLSLPVSLPRSQLSCDEGKCQQIR